MIGRLKQKRNCKPFTPSCYAILLLKLRRILFTLFTGAGLCVKQTRWFLFTFAVRDRWLWQGWDNSGREQSEVDAMNVLRRHGLLIVAKRSKHLYHTAYLFKTINQRAALEWEIGGKVYRSSKYLRLESEPLAVTLSIDSCIRQHRNQQASGHRANSCCHNGRVKIELPPNDEDSTARM